MDHGIARIVVAAIAHVHMHFTNFVADQLIHLFHLLSQRVAIIRISCEALCANEPSTPTAYRNADLVAELIRLAGLALSNALDFWLVNTLHLVLVMPLLAMNATRRIQQPR